MPARASGGKDAREGIGTLAALLELYGTKHGHKLKSWPECRRRIDSVFAACLGRPLATMKAGDLQMIADAWPAQQSAAAAVRYLRPVLKWAAQRQFGPALLADIILPATVRRRQRVLVRDELAALLPAGGTAKPAALIFASAPGDGLQAIAFYGNLP